MNGVIADWERVTIIGKIPQKPKVTRKESDLNGMSFTGIDVTFTSAHHSTSDSVSEEVCSFDDAFTDTPLSGSYDFYLIQGLEREPCLALTYRPNPAQAGVERTKRLQFGG